MAKKIVSWLSIGVLAILLGISAIACSQATAAEQTPAQPSASAAPVAPPAAPLAQQISAKQSTQIERPVATFKGRPTPSEAFPFSDEEYIAAGKCVIRNRPDMKWVKIGAPLEIREYYHFINVTYKIENPSPSTPNVLPINFRPGDALIPFYIPPGATSEGLMRC